MLRYFILARFSSLGFVDTLSPTFFALKKNTRAKEGDPDGWRAMVAFEVFFWVGESVNLLCWSFRLY